MIFSGSFFGYTICVGKIIYIRYISKNSFLLLFLWYMSKKGMLFSFTHVIVSEISNCFYFVKVSLLYHDLPMWIDDIFNSICP
jgi:hypothetical protein